MIKNSPSRAEGVGSIHDLGSQDPKWLVAKNGNIKQKQCNKFNEDFKNGSHKKKNSTFKTKSKLEIAILPLPVVTLVLTWKAGPTSPPSGFPTDPTCCLISSKGIA